MSDLDPAIMDQFYMKDGVSASEVTRVSQALTREPVFFNSVQVVIKYLDEKQPPPIP